MIRSAAVLGAGIMGGSVALHLARRGVHVTLFDRAGEPFTGASRWNEGKIHLGYLYAADPGMRTAAAVLPGGLDFRNQVERLTGIDLASATSTADDHYLVHRDSVVGPEAVGAYCDRVSELVASAPGARRYLVDVSACRAQRLTQAELAQVADPDVVVAGFRVPERSVDTVVVGDAFVAALATQPSLDLSFGRTVDAVRPAGTDGDRWVVVVDGAEHGPFDAVVNALWEGRPAVDATLGHQPDTAQQHRYRVSLFARSEEVVDAPCAVLSVGPFGDVKNYDGRAFYLSWYPTGLLARAEAVAAPAAPVLDDGQRARLAATVFEELTARLPWVERIRRAVTDVRVEGGWVYSQGRGDLDDPAATVHQRDRLGVSRLGTYRSVDTGKYSVAPTLAGQIADELTGSV